LNQHEEEALESYKELRARRGMGRYVEDIEAVQEEEQSNLLFAVWMNCLEVVIGGTIELAWCFVEVG